MNFKTVTGKVRDLVDMLQRRKVDILFVKDTRRKESKVQVVDRKRNGVDVVLKEEFLRNVLDVKKRVLDRVMSLKVLDG